MEKTSFSENKRALRIKELMKREGLKQKDIAELIPVPSRKKENKGELEPMDEQNFSRLLRSGKQIKEEICLCIIEHFPEYRLEWLLGYDDYMTEAEMIEDTRKMFHEAVDMRNKTADAVWCLLEHNLRKSGEHLIFHHPSGRHFDSFERHTSGCYYTIEDSQGNVKKRLSAEEMEKLEQKIIRICEILVDDIMLDINIFS